MECIRKECQRFCFRLPAFLRNTNVVCVQVAALQGKEHGCDVSVIVCYMGIVRTRLPYNMELQVALTQTLVSEFSEAVFCKSEYVYPQRDRTLL
jgi:hypothetical protein